MPEYLSRRMPVVNVEFTSDDIDLILEAVRLEKYKEMNRIYTKGGVDLPLKESQKSGFLLRLEKVEKHLVKAGEMAR